MNQTALGFNEKKIICILSSLPTKYQLELADTLEQIGFWLECRYFYRLVALCLEARYTGKDDPLYPLVQSKQLERDTYERAWLLSNYYYQLWSLAQLVTPYVQQELKGTGLEFLAESALRLFRLLIVYSGSQNFEDCLKPYHEESSRKHEKICRLGAKKYNKGLAPEEETKLNKLLKQTKPDFLLSLVVGVAHQKATKRRPALRSQLRIFNLSVEELCKKEATVSRKWDSYAWKDGRKIKASRYGGTYSDA